MLAAEIQGDHQRPPSLFIPSQCGCVYKFMDRPMPSGVCLAKDIYMMEKGESGERLRRPRRLALGCRAAIDKESGNDIRVDIRGGAPVSIYDAKAKAGADEIR